MTQVPVRDIGNSRLSNAHKKNKRPWSRIEGHDLGCHLGPISKGTWRCLALSRHDQHVLEFPALSAARPKKKDSRQTGNYDGEIRVSSKHFD